jgi:transposase
MDETCHERDGRLDPPSGKGVWRGKCLSDPAAVVTLLRKHARSPMRVVFETGPLSVWFYQALREAGLPAICIDARHARAALDMAANKTDANDADGLAHLAKSASTGRSASKAPRA